ncbi:MAG: helix-turn-helix domain-containing protein, partial [Opitutales bacterium]
MSKPPPRLADIARAGNVSVMTVSMALRDHPRISQATRDRIKALAAEMNYRRDPI